MSIISSKDVYNIIKKSLEIVDAKIMQHGEITGYILYKMLQYQGNINQTELAEYTMLGLIHDIGLYKTGYKGGFGSVETTDVWAHSIYGYLFMKNLTPMHDKAEIILYHHLDYKKHNAIKSQYWTVTECLTLADKMDVFMRAEDNGMEPDYFAKNINVTFSAKALETFNMANAKYKITEKLGNGEYKKELDELLTSAHFSDTYKKEYLQMLSYTVDFRSEYTVVHSLATTAIAVELGRLLRKSGHDLQVLYYGALLHDIGKLAIPLKILEAPRKLTDEEMRIMKAHVIITERMLDGVIDDEVLQVAIRHHEKLDGTGYHRGIKGEELTENQRIVAVADIISALYGKRSYKEGMPSDKVKEILQSDADNGKICPKVVGIAIRNYDKIMKNFEVQREDTIDKYSGIMKQYEMIYAKFKGL